MKDTLFSRWYLVLMLGLSLIGVFVSHDMGKTLPLLGFLISVCCFSSLLGCNAGIRLFKKEYLKSLNKMLEEMGEPMLSLSPDPVEQPKGEGAAGETGSGLEGLRKAICDDLFKVRHYCAAQVVLGHFDKTNLVAFDRRDFELLHKHGLYPWIELESPPDDPAKWRFDCGGVFRDYLSALRAAIAEARRREEVQE